MVLTGLKIPSTLRLIKVKVFIAGLIVEKEFTPSSYLIYEFSWDRYNAYSQPEYGFVDVKG